MKTSRIKWGADGKGIEFGSRMLGFAALTVVVIGALVLNACGLVSDSVTIAAWSAFGAAAMALPIARGIEKAGKGKETTV